MILVESLISKLNKCKIDFFTGVPDSVLKPFSSFIENYKYKKHVIATSEGSAISIGIGYYLSKKKLPCIYFQNSGLGNALNPLISIANREIYSIPLLLIIGWRGSPNISDEPQHRAKGKITLSLLKLLKINYCILRNDNDLVKLNKLIGQAKKNKTIVACLIEKKTLQYKTKAKVIKKDNLITRAEFIEIFLKSTPAKSKIISTTGYTSRELLEIRRKLKKNEGSDFYMVGGMGHSSSVALGYALGSNKKIFCLDGDGSLLMHLGAMRTIGVTNKSGFKHILLNNNSHESVGAQPTYADGINFKNLSKSLGYKNYFQITKRQEIEKKIKKFLSVKGPSLLEVKIQNRSLKNLGRPKNLVKVKNKFMNN